MRRGHLDGLVDIPIWTERPEALTRWGRQTGRQGTTRPERVEEIGRVLRLGPCRHLDHHRARGAVGVDQLAMDSEADQDGPAGAGDDPELVPVPPTRQDELVVGARQTLTHPRPGGTFP